MRAAVARGIWGVSTREGIVLSVFVVVGGMMLLPVLFPEAAARGRMCPAVCAYGTRGGRRHAASPTEETGKEQRKGDSISMAVCSAVVMLEAGAPVVDGRATDALVGGADTCWGSKVQRRMKCQSRALCSSIEECTVPQAECAFLRGRSCVLH